MAATPDDMGANLFDRAELEARDGLQRLVHSIETGKNRVAAHLLETAAAALGALEPHLLVTALLMGLLALRLLLVLRRNPRTFALLFSAWLVWFGSALRADGEAAWARTRELGREAFRATDAFASALYAMALPSRLPRALRRGPGDALAGGCRPHPRVAALFVAAGLPGRRRRACGARLRPSSGPPPRRRHRQLLFQLSFLLVGPAVFFGLRTLVPPDRLPRVLWIVSTAISPSPSCRVPRRERERARGPPRARRRARRTFEVAGDAKPPTGSRGSRTIGRAKAGLRSALNAGAHRGAMAVAAARGPPRRRWLAF